MATARGEKRALLIAGPTASGKSAVALELAETFSGTVINADAMQVYRDLIYNNIERINAFLW